MAETIEDLDESVDCLARDAHAAASAARDVSGAPAGDQSLPGRAARGETSLGYV
jgi:hypothetical protein